MPNIGQKIYYDRVTGEALQRTAEKQGAWARQSTYEEDITAFTALSERNRDTFDVIELAFGEYAQDFAECNGYWVNPATKALEFSYPDPNQPEAPPVFVKPLTEQIAEKDVQIAEIKLVVTQVSEDLAAFMDYQLAKEETGGI